MGAAVLGLHGLGFLLLFASAGSHGPGAGAAGTLTVGLGLTAYALGMRHAFDADHIAAIDNTTRKLIGEGRRPLSVGFFFALGHSTVVFALALLFATGIAAFGGEVQDQGSALHELTGWIGPGVSAAFLYLIAFFNLVVLVGIARLGAELRRGRCGETELERRLAQRGMMSRFCSRFTGAVERPWQMYAVGLLFGLGFDTATEVALLFLAAGAAGAGLAPQAVLCLPLLFAAGMCLLDTLDGSLMNLVYGWAFAKPARRLFYNFTVTALSVLVAATIASVQLAELLSHGLGLRGEPWGWLAGLDLSAVGAVVAALFLVCWAGAIAAWRLGHLEQRWSGSLERR